MSRAGYLMPNLRWGQRMGDGGVMDMMVGALTDPFDTVHMGITAENIAAKWGISRETQDAFAVESHKRAINAIAKGYFKDQILPVEIKSKKGSTFFDSRRACARRCVGRRYGKTSRRVPKRWLRYGG